MKHSRNRKGQKPSHRKGKNKAKKQLPAPLTGLAYEDLMWDTVSPLASPIFDDLEQEPPPDEFWATVSGVAVYVDSLRQAKAAKVAYEDTTAPILRRVRKVEWLYREEMAARNAIRMWSALLRRLTTAYPDATDGQLWVLTRDAMRALRDELQMVAADGR
jgi:hypothetical protein